MLIIIYYKFTCHTYLKLFLQAIVIHCCMVFKAGFIKQKSCLFKFKTHYMLNQIYLLRSGILPSVRKTITCFFLWV